MVILLAMGCRAAPGPRACADVVAGEAPLDAVRRFAWAEAYDTRCDAAAVDARRRALCADAPASSSPDCSLSLDDALRGRVALVKLDDFSRQPAVSSPAPGVVEVERAWFGGFGPSVEQHARVRLTGVAPEDQGEARRFGCANAWAIIGRNEGEAGFVEAEREAYDRAFYEMDPRWPSAPDELTPDHVAIWHARALFLEGDHDGGRLALAAALRARIADIGAAHPSWQASPSAVAGPQP